MSGDSPARSVSSVEDYLRRRVEEGHVVVFVGAGISAAAAPGKPTATWKGLLRHGVSRCRELVPTLTPEWAERVLGEIGSEDVDELLSAAEKITDKLGGRSGGEYRLWLRDTVGSLQLEKPEIVSAVAGLGVPIVTTNYDSLVEQGTGLPPVSWRNWNKAHRLLLGQEQGVLHLHGYWDEAESVVLGLRSYDQILGDDRAKALLQALTLTKSCLFVGFGAGLDDPSFHSLRKWLATVLLQSEHRHFRLLREKELEAAAGQHARAERIVFISYGTQYGDLAPFIRSLRTSTPAGSPATTGPQEASVLPPPPRCFGRDAIIKAVVEQLLFNTPSPIPVLGPPGIGKTTICRAVLHDSSVADRYGIHRYFVRCEKVPTVGALMSAVGSTLGLPESSLLRANLMARLHAQRTLLVLDNIEDPWLGDTLAVEELLSAFGSVPTLGLIVSLRGAQRPTGPQWSESVQVPQLPLDQARKVFLAIAGERYGEDPNLAPLLTDLDGMPLAIELLAGAAEGEPDLAALRRRWTQERTGLLRRAGTAGPPMSAAASFELSISSPLMTAEARRLLSLLAAVPTGISHNDLPRLESEIGEDAAPTLRKVGLAFDEASCLRTLKPIADYVLAQHPPEQKDLALLSALRDGGIGESLGSITSEPPKTTGEAAAAPGKPGGLAEFYDQWRPLLQKLGQEVLEYICSQPDPAEPITARALARGLAQGGSTSIYDLSPQQVARLIGDAQTHGFVPGLMRNANGFFVAEDHIAFKLTQNEEAKRQIAAAARSFVRPRMSVALDGGSTTLPIADALVKAMEAGDLWDLTIVTNSLSVAERIGEFVDRLGCSDEDAPVTLVVCAGRVRAQTRAVADLSIDTHTAEQSIGEIAEALGEFDYCFVGANGMTEADGITMPTRYELPLKRRMIEASREPIIVADASKFGVCCSFKIADWSEPVTLLTNHPTDRSSELDRIVATHPTARIQFAELIATT